MKVNFLRGVISINFSHVDYLQLPCMITCTQDGSCNGLQHYAALGRDYLGGKKARLETMPN